MLCCKRHLLLAIIWVDGVDGFLEVPLVVPEGAREAAAGGIPLGGAAPKRVVRLHHKMCRIMLCQSALSYAVLSYAVLSYTALSYALLCLIRLVLRCTVLRYNVLRCPVLRCRVLRCRVLRCFVLHSAL